MEFSNKLYYTNETGSFSLINGDTFKELKKFTNKRFDMIFADPPYFLSNDGITCSGGKMVSVNKGDWDRTLTQEDKHKFNKKWIRECYRILKDTGTIWISGTLHNIYSIGMALEEEGFKILNNITWQKTNPPPNLACKNIYALNRNNFMGKERFKNVKYTFNYEVMKQMNGNKQMKDVWTTSLTKPSEKKARKTSDTKNL